MITDEQIRESEWQNGVYQLKKKLLDLVVVKYLKMLKSVWKIC